MVPVTDSGHVAGDAVKSVGDTRLAVSDTLLNNFTSVLSLVVPSRRVSRKVGVDPGSGHTCAGFGYGGCDGGAGQDVG